MGESEQSTSRHKLKDNIFLAMTWSLGRLSTCGRAQVGAIIVKDGRAISWGYNGAPPGLPHCDENDHGWENTAEALRYEGCRNATHAEMNAIAAAARQGISTDGGTIYVSYAPCVECARLLIASGIIRVVYAVEYRDENGKDLLGKAGIPFEWRGSEEVQITF